jgi:hypothetical protein
MTGFRVFLAISLLIITTSAAAFTIRFDPPNPSSHDAVRVWTYTICPASFRANVQRTGQSFIIDFPARDVGCIATPTPVLTSVNLGVLEGGTYEVSARIMGEEIGRRSLEVRGVDPFALYPAGVPTSGGGEVQIGTLWQFSSGQESVRVFFGTSEARVFHSGPVLAAEPPPHSAGLVDVTVMAGEERIVARQAFKYYEPSTVPEPFVFERLLLPVHHSGPGANGSEWRTDTFIGSTFYHLGRPLIFHAPPCSTCSTRITAPVHLDLERQNEGLILYLARGGRENLAVSSRARDVSRQLLTAGTEIPVVGTEQFREFILIPNIPAEPAHRYMLRLWALRNPGRSGLFPIVVSSTNASEGTNELLWTTADPDLLFRAIDLTPLIAKFPVGERLTLRVGDMQESIWALLSITNNDTQHVTVIAPHAFDR